MHDVFMDKRLQEKALRDGRLKREEYQKELDALPDASANVQEFDEDGNPINPPERKLKVLPVKPAEPEPLIQPVTDADDPLSDAWEDR